MTSKYCFSIILAGALLTFCSCHAQNEDIKPMFECSEVLDNPYGICTHINRKGEDREFDTRDRDLAMIESAGATFIRTGFRWDLCEDRKSKAQTFSHYDTMMSSVKSDMNMLAILHPFNKLRPLSEWGEFVSSAAGHFPTVRYWEVVNEADLLYKKYPEYDAREYVDMLTSAYDGIKAADKKNMVLLSGVSGLANHYLDSVLCLDSAKHCDIVNIHRYANKDKEPESFIKDYWELHKLLAKYRVRKPVWLTETGCTTFEGWATEETQAMRLPRIFLISYACGIDKVFWYKSRSCEKIAHKEKYFGLWHWDYSLKPAYFAYKTLVEMCPDGSRPELTRRGNVYLAHWKRPDGKTVWALWTSKRKETVSLSAKGKYSCCDINGEKHLLTGHQIEATPSILYFVGDKKLTLTLED